MAGQFDRGLRGQGRGDKGAISGRLALIGAGASLELRQAVPLINGTFNKRPVSDP
jgi:hypothetical protein